MMSTRWVLMVLLAVGCTKRVNTCASDLECKDPAYPFCDVNGEFPASGGDTNVCTITPASCPVSRCGCVPNAMTCSVDKLVKCNSDGKSETTLTCGLGCSSTEARCLTFDPSNDLAAELTAAANEPDIVVPSGARIDTHTGVILDSANLPITVQSVLVTSGSAAIRVFIGKSFVFNSAVISGDYAFAAVAPGAITLQGRLNARASGVTAGPGAQEPTATCVGANGQQAASGGGDATIGGAAGGYNAAGLPGGAMSSAFIPLVGGCRGGSLVDASNNVLQRGGGGGGAVQLVSLAQVMLTNMGMIDVGAGGGRLSAGGGSGGIVVIEAPYVQLNGPLTGVTANGGAGGGCGVNGPDASADTTPAPGPSCPRASGGDGGTASLAAAGGAICFTSTCSTSYLGAGGGSVGRMRVATKDGTYGLVNSPVLSIATTTATLIRK